MWICGLFWAGRRTIWLSCISSQFFALLDVLFVYREVLRLLPTLINLRWFSFITSHGLKLVAFVMQRNLAFTRLDCDHYFGKMAKSPDISDVQCVLYVKDCHQYLEGHWIVVLLRLVFWHLILDDTYKSWDLAIWPYKLTSSHQASNIKASTRVSAYSIYRNASPYCQYGRLGRINRRISPQHTREW